LKLVSEMRHTAQEILHMLEHFGGIFVIKLFKFVYVIFTATTLVLMYV